jgi:small subunit ribosomal protein S19
MSRSKWKGPFVCNKTLSKIKFLKTNQTTNKNYLFASRNSEILPNFVGITFYVHNGKNYSEITINENMIGHKFGEFSFTRVKFIFKKKKLKK